MLQARKTSVWRSRYEVVADGRPVTTWDGAFWNNGGDFTLDGRRYEVRGNAWGSRFTMVDGSGAQLARAERVGRKRWTVEAGGRVHHFQRASVFGSEQELVTDGRRVGSVRCTSVWRGDVTADLPGLPLPVQIFVLGVAVAMWNAQAAASGAGG
ncbi:hypothetical protein GCM10010399_54140 [Dactylosporangium fulvum]|uniref:Uncharacterized protein n=1 Tax=Dactylosporangium fulvum TaxID=53359 RepID=A0ABY5WDE1_9ACTN|nr:hypothetical protein [Dactylosporangium fulvum]UWP87224.1 hypothetical protein Dfulv_24465 [Dactylosporangium fulvum]